MNNQYLVKGAKKETGTATISYVSARNKEEAESWADEQGILVEGTFSVPARKPRETRAVQLKRIEEHLGEIAYWVRFWSKLVLWVALGPIIVGVIGMAIRLFVH
jgi:hypothetical protein